MTTKSPFSTFFTCVSLAVAAASNVCLAGTTWNYNTGNGPDIALKWTDGGNPSPGTHFTVDFDCPTCEAYPNVAFLVGSDTWQVWSGNAPGREGDPLPNNELNIGEITVADEKNYTITVADDSGGNGAWDVTSMDLTVSTGYRTSLACGSKIGGDVDGNLTVVANGTSGGELCAEIGGDVDGDVTARTVPSGGTFKAGDISGNVWFKSDVPGNIWYGGVPSGKYLQIDGDALGNTALDGPVAGDVTVTGDLDGYLSITGNLSGDVVLNDVTEDASFGVHGDASSSSSVSIQAMEAWSGVVFDAEFAGTATVKTMYDAQFTISGAFSGTVTVTGTVSASEDFRMLMEFGEPTPGTDTFTGTLDLKNGIGSDAFVIFWYPVATGAEIDLWNGGIAGALMLARGGQGTVSNGGAITGNGADFQAPLTLAEVNGSVWAGTATFSSLASGSQVEVNYGTLSGTLHFTGAVNGDIAVREQFNSWGDIASTGKIEVDGYLGGDIEVEGDMNGNLDLDGSVGGDIEIGEEVDGVIDIAGDLDASGSVTVDGAGTGEIDIHGKAAGDVRAYGDLELDVTIGSYAAGDIKVDADLISDIDVGGYLESTGRILVNGMCEGSITVAENTERLSTIHCKGGLASTSTILINGDRGEYDAGGEIHVGETTGMNDVTFDGSIMIRDDTSDNGGDLDGTISVRGCHETDDDLDICLCGGDGYENITIAQSLCNPEVGYSCVTGCPSP